MKRKKHHVISLAALLMAGAAMMFTACSGSKDNDIIEPTPAQPVNGKYILTVNASKVVDAATRALSPDGNTINATWTKGDEVKVYNVTGEGPSESESGTPVGTLTAQRDGATTTLSGEFELTYTPTVGAKLRLKLNDDAVYTNQDGTLDYIATHCDKAVADIIVSTKCQTPCDWAVSGAIIQYEIVLHKVSELLCNYTSFLRQTKRQSRAPAPLCNPMCIKKNEISVFKLMEKAYLCTRNFKVTIKIWTK